MRIHTKIKIKNTFPLLLRSRQNVVVAQTLVALTHKICDVELINLACFFFEEYLICLLCLLSVVYSLLSDVTGVGAVPKKDLTTTLSHYFTGPKYQKSKAITG